MDNSEQMIQRYAHGIKMMEKLCNGVTADQMREHPIPGTWSLLENLCHIADFDSIQAERMKRAIALEEPAVLGADENLFARRLQYDRRDPVIESALIILTRKQMLSILSHLEPENFQRKCIHNESGPVTLFAILEKVAGHLEHHARHMNEKRKALGLEAVDV